MKISERIRHIETYPYYESVDYVAGTKSKREISCKLSLLEELTEVERNQTAKELMESKVESFMRELSLDSLDLISSYHIEDIIENSIVIRFAQRQDIRLNLYYDIPNTEFDNYEEACLSYIQDSRRKIMMGSISQITPKLLSLLS